MNNGNKVGECILNWFHKNKLNQKLKSNEWTVLAGFVLMDPNGHVFPIACATGNKCIGKNKMDKNGMIIHDSHAEILARRSLLRLLYLEIQTYLKSKANLNTNEKKTSKESIDFNPILNSCRILEYLPNQNQFQLKKGYSLHLYISEIPCGDASLYDMDPLNPSKSWKCVKKMKRNVTGAKPIEKHINENRFEKQEIGILRTKSGRSDLPLEYQTLSLSCSDKIAKWRFVGLQGSFLTSWIQPISLSSIVISIPSSTSMKEKEAMNESINRALNKRLNDLPSIPIYLINLPFIHSRDQIESRMIKKTIYEEEKNDKESLIKKRKCYTDHQECQPSSLAFNWYWNDSELNFSNSKFKIETILSAYGRKQGGKTKGSLTLKQSSRLSKQHFFHLMYQQIQLHQQYQSMFPELEWINTLDFSSITYKEMKNQSLIYNKLKQKLFHSSSFTKWNERKIRNYEEFTLSSK